MGRSEAEYQRPNGWQCYLLGVSRVQNEFSVITEAVVGVPPKVHDDPNGITVITSWWSALEYR